MYEIVIHARGAKAEIVSPTTYATLEGAARDLEPINEAITSDGVVSLPWYAGKADSINAAVVRETALSRPADGRSVNELLARLEQLGGVQRADPSAQ